MTDQHENITEISSRPVAHFGIQKSKESEDFQNSGHIAVSGSILDIGRSVHLYCQLNWILHSVMEREPSTSLFDSHYTYLANHNIFSFRLRPKRMFLLRRGILSFQDMNTE